MFKKIGIGIVLLVSLEISSLEASHHHGHAGPRIVEMPDFGDPYKSLNGFLRQTTLADRIELFVADDAAPNNSKEWCDELKKHLVQCDLLDLKTACLTVNGHIYSLKQFVDKGIDVMCQQRRLSEAARGRCALVKEAFEFAQLDSYAWQIIDQRAPEETLLSAIEQCIGHKDGAIFEGRCAYIAHRCEERSLDMQKKFVARSRGSSVSLESVLTAGWTSKDPRRSLLLKERTKKIKGAIANAQVNVRGIHIDF